MWTSDLVISNPLPPPPPRIRPSDGEHFVWTSDLAPSNPLKYTHAESELLEENFAETSNCSPEITSPLLGYLIMDTSLRPETNV